MLKKNYSENIFKKFFWFVCFFIVENDSTVQVLTFSVSLSHKILIVCSNPKKLSDKTF